jgi:hypothetical protein
MASRLEMEELNMNTKGYDVTTITTIIKRILKTVNT